MVSLGCTDDLEDRIKDTRKGMCQQQQSRLPVALEFLLCH